MCRPAVEMAGREDDMRARRIDPASQYAGMLLGVPLIASGDDRREMLPVEQNDDAVAGHSRWDCRGATPHVMTRGKPTPLHGT